MEKVHSAHILTCEERLALLVDKNKWLDALSLALDFYEGKAKAVVGLPSDLAARREIMSDKIIEIMISYVHITTTVRLKGPLSPLFRCCQSLTFAFP